jgi:hypothetical protein
MDPSTFESLSNNDELVRNNDGTVVIPRELEDAPEDVKTSYIKWLEMAEETKNSQKRYFSFINTITKSVETVDAMNLAGMAVRKAKEKNIGESELKQLEALCAEMESRKYLKSKYKWAWTKWVRPRVGRDVFDWRKAEMIDLYAKFCTHEEVKKIVEEWGYSVDISSVYKFFLRNKATIENKRTEFIRSSRDHYLATDAGRMETLAMLHTKFLNLFNNVYGKTEPNKEDLRKISSELRAIIEQARREVKGDEIKLTIDGRIDINASMQASITIQEISKKVPINIIPVYMVAAKQGIDPTHILSSLVHSFYKDYNGFNRIKNGTPPSTIDIIRNYDWNEITAYHANKPTEVPTMDQYEEVPFTEVPKIQSKREKLLSLIKEQVANKERPVDNE